MITPLALTPATPAAADLRVQRRLGDDEEAEQRLAEERDEVSDIIEHLNGGVISKPKDALSFARDIKYKAVGGQQLTCKCMFCNMSITSTGAVRIVDHFCKTCVLVPAEVKDPFVVMRGKTDSTRKQKAEHEELVRDEQEQQLRVIKAQKIELKQQSISAGFRSAEAEFADKCIAKFFYANAISFGAADTSPDSLYREMALAIQKAGAGYVPPGRKQIAGRLVDTCTTDMERDIAKRDEGGVMSDRFGMTYTQDGWESCDNLPLINSAYILANDGGVYISSVDTSGEIKNAEYIAALMIEDIYAIGCTKVILICTDTCTTMKKAWSICQDEFPWISIAPCQTHCPSLLATDISKMDEPAKTIKEETLVVGWFSNHQKPLAILRDKAKSAFGRSKELKKAGATRMGSTTSMGERLSELKTQLQQTVVDPAYVAQNYKDLPDDMEITNCATVSRQHKGGTAKKLVLDDDAKGFWNRVSDHVKLLSCHA